MRKSILLGVLVLALCAPAAFACFECVVDNGGGGYYSCSAPPTNGSGNCSCDIKVVCRNNACMEQCKVSGGVCINNYGCADGFPQNKKGEVKATIAGCKEGLSVTVTHIRVGDVSVDLPATAEQPSAVAACAQWTTLLFASPEACIATLDKLNAK